MSMNRPEGGLDLRVAGLEERFLSQRQWTKEESELNASRIQEHDRIASLAPGGA